MNLQEWLRKFSAAVSSGNRAASISRSVRRRQSSVRRAANTESLEFRTLLAGTGLDDDPGDIDDHDHEILPHSDLNVTSAFNYGGFLTEPSAVSPLEIAEKYITENSTELGFDASESITHVVTNSYESSHTGVTHVYLQQTVNGLPVENAVLNVNVMPDGRILNAASTFVSGLTASEAGALSTDPQVSASSALESLATAFEWTFSEDAAPAGDVSFDTAAPWLSDWFQEPQFQSTVIASAVSTTEIPAHLQYVATTDGLELSWKLNVQTPDGLHWYDASVSAEDGDVLIVSDWVANATYNVFEAPKQSPYDGPRTLAVDPQDATASPFGWHDDDGVAGAEYTVTQGNNVFAYTDTDNDNVPDANSAPDGGAGLVFDFTFNPAVEPDQYRPAAVTNLFYWNNFTHDVLYQYGFDEPSGNFQENNYGNGGAGGDFVHAQAQDGADLGTRNNANFGTPPDGSNPRMQMYLFSLTTPERGSSMDAEIIVHEYGHGVSNRLTGGPGNSGALSNIQSRGMGEGWSDILSLLLTQEATDSANAGRGVGTYALGQAITGPGVRTQRYSYDFAINNHTFADIIGAGSVHFIGENWATVLWDLNWALIDGNSLDANLQTPGLGFDPDIYNGTGGNNFAMQLIMDGMKLQPANPSLLDARDAILAADVALTGGLYQDTIWRVFARRGMGYSADDGGGSATTNVTEAFDLPPAPQPPALRPFNPPGSNINHLQNSTNILGLGEVDPITIDIDAGQTLSIALTSGATLRGSVELRDPNDTVVATATAVTDGDFVLMQLEPVLLDGTYTINVSGDGNTVGSYTLDVILNAAIEAEEFGGSSNNSIFTAQNIDATAQDVVDSTSTRLAVAGTSNGGSDFYSFTLTAGQPNSFVVSGDQVSIDLVNFFGGRLATGIAGYSPGQSINNFVPQADGTYGVRIRANGDYGLVVTRNSDFEYENNDNAAESQRLQAGGRVLGNTGDAPPAPGPFSVGPTTGATGGASGFETVGGSDGDPPPGGQKVIVQFADTFGPADVNAWAVENNAWVQTHLKHVFNGAIVYIPADADIESTTAAWNSTSEVVLAEADQVGEYFATPDDTLFSQMWGLHNTGQTGGTADADIDAPEAWDLITDSSSVVIAIVDSGVNYNHPDLNPRMWVNAGEIAGNGIDDDSNGFIDDVYGIDAANGTGDPMDGFGHGTHVAGTTAAFGNNALGVTGVNWNASIMAFSIGTAGPSTAAAIVALDYLVDQKVNHGVNVVSSNHSYGVGDTVAFQTAIQASINAGVVFVAAAGNSNQDNDASPAYPSSYPYDGVIAVAATDHNDGKAGFSSYGATTVDIGAPGVNILSTMLTSGGISDPSGYGAIQGTSMASPHVAGAAAMLAAYNPGATVAEIKAALLDGSDPVASMAGITVSGGRLNLLGALNQLGPGGPGPGPGPTSSDEDFSDDFYTIAVAAGDVLSVSTTTPFDAPLDAANTLDPMIELFDPTGASVASDDNSAADGRNAALTHTAALPGDYVVRVTAVAGEGAYTLDIVGDAGMDPDPFVADSDPAFDAISKLFPASYTLTFNEPLLIPSVQADDFTFDGFPASAVRFLDGQTVEFDIDPALSRGEVTYDVVLAAGSVLDLQGRPNTEWTTTFTRDITPPTIVTTTWNTQPLPANRVLADGPLLLDVQFSEAMKLPPASAIILEDTVRGIFHLPTSVVPGTDTIAIQFPHLRESDYKLTLVGATGGFEDLASLGLDGEAIGPDTDGAPTGDGFVDGDYVIDFRIDIGTKAAEFGRLEPFGTLLAQSTSNVGYINQLGDADTFSFYAEAGEVISAEVLQLAPTGFTSTAVKLSDANGTVAGPFVGEHAYMPPEVITVSGLYELEVRGSVVMDYEFTINRGLVTEFTAGGDTEDGNEVAIDATFVPIGTDGGGRYGASGISEPVVVTPPPTFGSALFGVQPATGEIVEVDPGTGAIVRSFPAPAGISATDTSIGLSGAENNTALLYTNSHVANTELFRLDPVDGSVLSVEAKESWDTDGVGYEHDGTSDLIFTSHSSADLHQAAGYGSPEVFSWATGAPIGGVAGDGFDRSFALFTDGMIHEYNPFIDEDAYISDLTPPAPDIEGLAFDGTNLFASTASGDLYTLDPDTGSVINVAPVAGGALFALGAIVTSAPPVLPDLLYVIERDGPNDPGGHVSIFDYDGNPVDMIDHPRFDDGVISDVEIGPNGDVFVALDLDGTTQPTGELVHFLADGTFVGSISVPDHPGSNGHYPFGFDVLADGRFLMPHPGPEAVLILNPDGTLQSTIPMPGINPADAAVLSDGTIVVSDIGHPTAREFKINVNPDDTFWVGLSAGDSVELRDRTGTVLATRSGANFSDAQETPDGSLFVVGWTSDVVTKFDGAGNQLFTIPANDSTGLAVASGEVFGTPSFSNDGAVRVIAVGSDSTLEFTASAAFDNSPPAGSYLSTALLGVELIANSPGVLYDIDKVTGVASNPRATTVEEPIGITLGPDGLLYTIDDTNGSFLHTIDPATGATTTIGFTGRNFDEGDLDFNPVTGELFALWSFGQFNVELTRIDTATGQVSGVVALPSDPFVTAMAFDSTGTLYALSDVFGGPDELLTIDTTTGQVLSTTVIVGADLSPTAGMDFDSETGELFVAGDSVYTLDIGTGNLTLVGNSGLTNRISGLEFIDVGPNVTPDVDEFTLNLSGHVGESVDILLEGRDGIDFSSETFELLAPNGSTVLATGQASPLGTSGSYDLGILGFTVPANGTYTMRLTSAVAGQYGIGVVRSVPFDLEPNDSTADRLKTFTTTSPPLGYLSGNSAQEDWFEFDLPAGQPVEISTRTLYDNVLQSPLNALDPSLTIYAPDGTTVIATDLNSAVDGRNAVARFTTGIAGLYKVAVGAEVGSGEGEYSVAVSTPQLMLTLDDLVISEGDGIAATSATIMRTGDTGLDLDVILTNGDASEIGIPVSVVIPAGQSSVSFPVDAIDDLILDGTQTVQIDATAADYLSSSVTIDVTDDDIAGITVTETPIGTVVSETGTMDTFDVVLNAGPLSNVEILISSSDTAEATTDTLRLVFTPTDWMTPQTVTVTGIDDAHVDGTQTIQVSADVDTSVSDASYGAVAGETVDVDVTDNDNATVTIADTSVTEGGIALFTLTLDNAVENPFNVNVALIDGTAQRGQDFVNSTPVAAFTGLAGETQQIAVATIDDAVLEGDETFTARLTGGVPLVTAVDSATGTILDNDEAVLTISDVEVTEGDNMSFTVSLGATVDTSFDVQVGLLDITATGGTSLPADYRSGGPLLRFVGQAGETQRFIIPTFDDSVREPSESYRVTLTSTHPLVDDTATSTGTIHDNDTATLAVQDVTTTEGGDLVFEVTLDTNVSVPFDVTADLTDITATGGAALPADYVNQSQVLSFTGTAGEAFQFTVPTFDNPAVEAVERFLVQLSATTTLVDTSDTATGTINDDDSATISIDDQTVVEGSGGGTTDIVFTVTLDAEVDIPVRVSFSTANDTASDSDGDLTFTTGVVTFDALTGPGPQTKQFTVPVTADDVVELDEGFFVNLHTVAATGRDVTIADGKAAAGIIDDDSATVSIGDVSSTEGSEGLTEFQFEVVLSSVVDVQVDVNYSTADGSALEADGDYVPRIGVLDFAGNASGPQTLTVVVQVTADEKVELDEDFTLNLLSIVGNGRNVSFGDNTGLGSITDDDTATLSLDHVSALEGDQGNSSFVISLVLDHPVDAAVGVDIDLSDGTAKAGSDYIGGGAHFDFLPGTQVMTFSVPVIGDRRIEADETFTALLSNLTTNGRSVILDATPGIATILNDDTGVLDIDDDATANAATDGILALRYLFGFRGTALTNGAIGGGAVNTTSGEVEDVLNSSLEMLDVDGNGVRDAATDGILIIRYLFGFRDDALVNGAVGPGATRTTGAEVAAFLDEFTPLPPPPPAAPQASPSAFAAGDDGGITPATVTVAVASGTPSISWVPVANADRYLLTVESMDTDEQIVVTSTASTSYSTAAPLTSGGYRVWVEALGSSGSVLATLTTTFNVAIATDNLPAEDVRLLQLRSALQGRLTTPVSGLNSVEDPAISVQVEASGNEEQSPSEPPSPSASEHQRLPAAEFIPAAVGTSEEILPAEAVEQNPIADNAATDLVMAQLTTVADWLDSLQ